MKCTWCGSVTQPNFLATLQPARSGNSGASGVVRIDFPRTAAADANAAMDQLFAAFPDHQPSLVSESAGGWTFELHWTSDPDTFVDPAVADAAAQLHGLELSELGAYHEVVEWGGRDVVFSMIHGWALLAPSLAIQRRGGRPLAWVVHVDDHTDLMAPMVEPTPRLGLLRDTVFGVAIDVADPTSVVAAVERGTVSKGNFLTAYLLAYPGSQVVHVGLDVTEASFALESQGETVVLGGTRFTRTALPLLRAPGAAGSVFRKSRLLPRELPVTGDGGVWLDIDLDYFWNRYDGDSDRRLRTAQPNERDEVRRRVQQFLNDLSEVQWLTEIEAVSLAVSPGFFPADHWAEALPVLREGLQRVLRR